MSAAVLKVHPEDNVLVALRDLKAGETVDYQGESYTLASDVPAKHKFPIGDLESGAQVYMYGVLVGQTTQAVRAGEMLTTFNLHHAAQELSLETGPFHWEAPDVSEFEQATFNGFHREDGSVGTANYWVVIPMVFCENRNLQILREALQDQLGYGKADKYRQMASLMVESYREGVRPEAIEDLQLSGQNPVPGAERLFPQVDGIKFLIHQQGCGGTRGDSDALCGLLAGYICHPNVAGATVLSLGCQHAEVATLQEEIVKRSPRFAKPFQVFEQQQYPSEERLMEDAMKHIFAGVARANEQIREPAPLAKLGVGLECGASDGFSGLSSNPTIGQASDLLAGLGASSILAEFPELCGVENEIVRRCKDRRTAERFAHLMRAYSKKAEEAGSGFDMNPSPGNIKDGLITDAIKSAGAAKKGGTGPINDVLDYPEKLTEPGLNLLCTPGNDVESTTALAAAGANLILFSTGLGTPTGNPVAPVIKISSNSELAAKMPELIDFDAGPVIRGEATIEQMGRELLRFIVRVASGQVIPRAVELGQEDFIPWKRGVSL